jgi:Zinc knuckle
MMRLPRVGTPLRLKALIEKIVMAQTEHQYYAETMLDQEKILLGFGQGNMSNAQYYEKISNRINVDKSVGITRVHKVAVQAIANKQYSKKVEDLIVDELEKAEEAAEESYLAYIMIMNSSTEHNKLKTSSLADDYANGKDTYPKNRQDSLRLLDTFTRNATPRAIETEGSSFATMKKPNKKEQDEAYWKDKECYNCGETGHPARECPNKDAKSKKSKDTKGKGKPKDDKSDEDSVESKKSTKSNKSKSSRSKSMLD